MTRCIGACALLWRQNAYAWTLPCINLLLLVLHCSEVEEHRRGPYLVIICELHSGLYVLLGVYDDVLVTLHCYDLCVAVGVTAVIDEASQPTLHKRMNQCIFSTVMIFV
jgi:hypothetical protein